ncbi:hypothetical protein NXV74_11745 [Bacteroides thetaiotaomicron]|nr:hypothetical protein [Bacteroides thetaiotaomicron]
MLPQKVLWLINARFCRQILPLTQSERGDFTDKPQAPTLQDERHDGYLCNTILIRVPMGWYMADSMVQQCNCTLQVEIRL